MKRFLPTFQKLGKSLMLPIAFLPVAAILLRIGQPELLNLPFVAAAGQVLFDNLPILFAIGVAIGFAEGGKGAAALAGAVGYLVLSGTSAATFAWITANFDWANHLYKTMIDFQSVHFGDIFAGICAGLIAGITYNRFRKVKLPSLLSFFQGERLVPIMASLFTFLAGILFGFVWPFVQGLLDGFGVLLAGLGYFGQFIFGVLNRLSLAVGLHQVLDSYFWFEFGTYTDATGAIVQGDMPRFFAGDPTAGGFMTGFYPIVMFALPAIALAFYVTAKKKNRPMIAGVLLSVGCTAFLTGITEPIEFLLMFLAPGLYVVHGVLTGISMAVSSWLQIRLGFGFSAGLFDYLLNWKFGTNPGLILVLGLIFGAVYFFLFVFLIRTFRLKTPGREDVMESEVFVEQLDELGMERLAMEIIGALGGKENVAEIMPCITSIRLTLVGNDGVNEDALMALGVAEITKTDAKGVQILIGNKADELAVAMQEICSHEEPRKPVGTGEE